MKITIIGAGNIGSAVAACLTKGHLYNEKDIIISTPHTDKLENLHKQFPAIRSFFIAFNSSSSLPGAYPVCE